MTQTLILKTNETPTYFNKEAAIGFLLGGPIGVVIGAIIGKNRMDSERAVGKPIGEPTAWNKDSLLGGLLGQVAGIIAGGVVGLMAISTPGAMELMMISGALLGTVAGAVIGGQSGKQEMQQEYVQAAMQAGAAQQMSRGGNEMAPALAENIAHSQEHATKIIAERQRTASQQYGVA